MERFLLAIILVIATIFLLYYFQPMLTGLFIGFGQPTNSTWFNTTWRYRFRIEITPRTDVEDWPIELKINFSDLLPYGSFDENSIRVFEYSENGNLLYEVPSQFDKSDEYSPNNAVGELIFILNGTTQANQKRIFYVYYDSLDNGIKEAKSYDILFNVSMNSRFVNINTTDMAFYIDTFRQGYAGIYQVIRNSDGIFIVSIDENQKPIEYTELHNGTNVLTFDLNDERKLIVGPARVTLILKGCEIEASTLEKTNELCLEKKYHFYNTRFLDGSYVRVEQKFYNAPYTIARESTQAGAIALDLSRAFQLDPEYIDCNEDNPYSYCLAGAYAYGYAGGIINLNSYSQFYAKNETETIGRIGLHMSQTDIRENEILYSNSIVYFGAYGEAGASQVFHAIRLSYVNEPIIEISKPERIFVNVSIQTNATIFNRNETLLIEVNITEDPYRLAKYLNATFDLGTSESYDDITVILYDDGTNGDRIAGDKIYSGVFVIPIYGNVGRWRVNVTIYDKDYIYLDSAEYYFNVTDILNVDVKVLNKILMQGKTNFAVVNVKNYRNDSYVRGASIVCSYGEYITNNYTDYNNGTYLVNFTNPPYGDYHLICNATKDNNFGQNLDHFFSQAAKTEVEVRVIPNYIELKNVSYYRNETFGFYVNATNIGKGVAYLANISFEVPQGWLSPPESKECNDIGMGESCYKYFTITTDENLVGVFTINVTLTWTNPDDSLGINTTTLTVNILPNPILRVDKKYITSIVKDGLNVSIENITVFSEGNYNLTNITFACISPNCQNFVLTFEPSLIEVLRPGEASSSRIYVFTPLGLTPGQHNLTINVSSSEAYDIFTLGVILQHKTNVSITLTPTFYITQRISLYEGDSFEFLTFVRNIHNSSARNVNISLRLPSGWSANQTIENCGNLVSQEGCSKSFNVTIPNSISPGNYQVRVFVNWTNLDNTLSYNSTIFQVTILSNPLIDVLEKEISKKIQPSEESYFGNITVFSVGNDRLRNVSFSCIGEYCKDFGLKFNPSNFDLESGRTQSVSINVTVPFNYPAGNYNLTINVSSSNSLNFATFNMVITVSENRTWDLAPIECKKSQYPSEGIACIVNISNLGNVNITYFVSPEEGNYTKIENKSFLVRANSTFKLYVSYNVTGVPENIYVSEFTVYAIEEDAIPREKHFRVVLLPFTPPEILVYFDSEEIEQNTTIKIYANITDRTFTGIKDVILTVTQPNGSSYSSRMKLIDRERNVFVYSLEYPKEVGGDTLQVGYYNATVYAEDNIGNYDFGFNMFKVRKSFVIFVSTLSSLYYQGDIATIYFSARSFEGLPVENVRTFLKAYDPSGRVIYSSSLYTDKEGLLSPMPTFQISSDASIGNYTLSAVAYYTDANVTTVKEMNSTFTVIKRAITVTGLFADISTAVVWFPNNIMKFGMLVYDGEGKPVDPEFMNLTVYDPAGNVYLSVGISQMTRESVGFYSYKYAMPPNTASGMYLAVLNVSRGEFTTMKIYSFRVAQGGPYDVKVIPLEYEVAQGEELDFNILIINMGEVSQDVFIEYWISSPDGTRYFSSSEAVYTPALTNKTFLRTAYIFSNQPLGLYYINVKVTYDYVQPPIIANASFIVVARNVTQVERPVVQVPIPTGQVVVPVPLPIPTANLTTGILIEKYPRNVSLARNIIKSEVVVVRNIGGSSLNNVTLTLVGLPLAWFNITPSNYQRLDSNQTAVFVITFNIPKNANVGTFPATLIASSNLIADSKEISINIYKSIEDLLEEEISKLESEYAELVIEAKVAQKEGKDVSVVLSLLEKIREELRNARTNLANKNYDEAVKNVDNAKTLIARVRELLLSLEVKPKTFLERLSEFSIGLKVFVFPLWSILVFIVIVLFVLSAILAFIVFKRKEKVRIPVILSVSKLVELARKKESREDILREREEILRALRALEKSRQEKIISEEAYKSMKKNLEEKLAKIDKKIK